MTDTSSLSSSYEQSTVENLCRYQRSLAELLRHFWACFPVVNQQLEQKVRACIILITTCIIVFTCILLVGP